MRRHGRGRVRSMHRHGRGYYPCTGMDEGTIHALAWTRVLPIHRHGRGKILSTHWHGRKRVLIMHSKWLHRRCVLLLYYCVLFAVSNISFICTGIYSNHYYPCNAWTSVRTIHASAYPSYIYIRAPAWTRVGTIHALACTKTPTIHALARMRVRTGVVYCRLLFIFIYVRF